MNGAESNIMSSKEMPRKDATDSEESAPEVVSIPSESAKQPIIWENVAFFVILHIVAIHFIVVKSKEAKIQTWIFNVLYGYAAGLGITAGAHRLWSHRCYSAKVPLRVLLALMYSISGQYSLYNWIRDHRTHHKFTETQADPFDATRGFFYAHIGWNLVRRHPAVKFNGSKVDMSDIEAEPVLRIFNKYHTPVVLFFSFLLPVVIPVYFWNETWDLSIRFIVFSFILRYNIIALVNSAAHMWGNRPYNMNIQSGENPAVSMLTLGEGWHNYHHMFPSDYKAAELGAYSLNMTTGFIDAMGWLGLAYKMKSPSDDLVKKTSKSKGDGSSSLWGNSHNSK